MLVLNSTRFQRAVQTSLLYEARWLVTQKGTGLFHRGASTKIDRQTDRQMHRYIDRDYFFFLVFPLQTGFPSVIQASPELCSPDWPQSCSNHPASDTQVLGLLAYATISSLNTWRGWNPDPFLFCFSEVNIFLSHVPTTKYKAIQRPKERGSTFETVNQNKLFLLSKSVFSGIC